MDNEMYCIRCRYHLKALTEHRCPECGLAFDPTNQFSYLRSPRTHLRLNTILGMTLLGMVLLWGAAGSGDIRMFIDINSMIWVLGIVAAGLWMCFGPITAVNALFKAMFTDDIYDEVRFTQIMAVLARGYQLAWAAGLSGTLLGIIIMCRNMSDPAAIGPGMGVALLTIVYGLILAEFIFSPLQQIVISRTTVPMSRVPWLTIPQRSMMLLCIAFILIIGAVFLLLMVTQAP